MSQPPCLHPMHGVIRLGGCLCKIHNCLCADCAWCRSPRQGGLIFNNDYHFRVHSNLPLWPTHSINRTEASHPGLPGLPGGPASRSRGCNGDTCHPCPTPSPCCWSLPVPECHPVSRLLDLTFPAQLCPALPLPCPPCLPCSFWSFACLFALCWQLAVLRAWARGEGVTGVGLHNSTGMGAKVASSNHLAHRPPQPSLSCLSLTCVSVSHPIAVVRSFYSLACLVLQHTSHMVAARF
jgi:hypothetical protein